MASAVLNAAEIQELRCEYRTSPLGMDIRSPRLSWVMQSDRRGEIQTAYQVLVASSPNLLRQDKGVSWDSGKMDSDRSTQIEYSGKPLASHQPAYWKVRVWDAYGRDGRFQESRPAGPWAFRARPNGRRNGSDATTPGVRLRKRQGEVPPRNLFEKGVHAGTKSRQRAVLYLTSLGVAEPHLNGGKVGEDYLSPGWTDFNKRVYYLPTT